MLTRTYMFGKWSSDQCEAMLRVRRVVPIAMGRVNRTILKI